GLGSQQGPNRVRAIRCSVKAARLFSYDKPLKIVDVEAPRIKNPSEVLVRVTGAGVCHTDLHIVEGVWREKVQVNLPYTLGHENAGVVQEVGDAVTSFKKGEKVIVHPVITDGTCRPCRIGEDMHCENLVFPGITADGRRDPVKQVMDITGNRGADVVIDLVGNDLTLANGMKMLHKGGTLIIVGYGGTLSVKAIDVIFSEFSVLGSLVGNWDELRELMELTRQGKVRVITQKGKLDEVNDI